MRFELIIKFDNSSSDISGRILASPLPLKPSMFGISNLPEEIRSSKSAIDTFCIREAVDPK